MLQTGELIRDGRSKRIYATDDPKKAVIYFKDEAMAFHGLKRGRILGKGEVNNAVSRTFFNLLSQNGVDNHYIEQLDSRQSLIWRCDMLPVSVKVRNRAAGSLCDRLGVEEGFRCPNTVLDLRYNNDELEDPFINRDHAVALGLATYQELDWMYNVARRVNELLVPLFHKAGIELVDMKIEFGRASDTGTIIISDEISPDTCRLWDEATGERMDKDRFRLDLSCVVENYRNVLNRLTEAIKKEE